MYVLLHSDYSILTEIQFFFQCVSLSIWAAVKKSHRLDDLKYSLLKFRGWKPKIRVPGHGQVHVTSLFLVYR